ncbi:MAG: hypothetical protein KJ666_16465 [Bacteroidetes bacterium]|nr:hypothetical protein [Bacteroidota bacterium]
MVFSIHPDPHLELISVGYSKTSLYLQVLEFPTCFTAYAVQRMGSEASREPIWNENSVDCVTSDLH